MLRGMSRLQCALLWKYRQAWWALCLLGSAGCTALGERAASSPYKCMSRMRDQVAIQEVPDARKHCLASALIARHCSVSEAWFAGVGKEFTDIFTAGDPSWADWRADRAGMRCGREAADDDLPSCCAAAGY